MEVAHHGQHPKVLASLHAGTDDGRDAGVRACQLAHGQGRGAGRPEAGDDRAVQHRDR